MAIWRGGILVGAVVTMWTHCIGSCSLHNNLILMESPVLKVRILNKYLNIIGEQFSNNWRYCKEKSRLPKCLQWDIIASKVPCMVYTYKVWCDNSDKSQFWFLRVPIHNFVNKFECHHDKFQNFQKFYKSYQLFRSIGLGTRMYIFQCNK